MNRISLAILLAMTSMAGAATISDFAMTFDSVVTQGNDLLFKKPRISNPPVPLIVTEPAVDGSGWSNDGDQVIIYNPSNPLHDISITGFDSPIMAIHVDLDCVMDQPFVPAASIFAKPFQNITCDVVGITHENNPSVLGTPIVLDPNKMWISANGAFFDNQGDAVTPYLASASATGTKVHFVNEPHANAMMLGGILVLAVGGAVRSWVITRLE